MESLLENTDNPELERLVYDWKDQARPNQLRPPGKWSTWLLLAGRGFGKTKTGAETVRSWAEERIDRIALIGRTSADVRDVIINGESGIIACSPPSFRPKHVPSKRLLEWPNGIQAFTYSSDEPDQLRGPQHGAALLDELAAYHNPEAVWSNLQFGLRLGDNPKAVITTTPRPIPLIKKLVKKAESKKGSVVITRGSTMDNARNLPDSFLSEVLENYGGTNLGRQELEGLIIDDSDGALWSRDNIDDGRFDIGYEPPGGWMSVAIAVDPATTSKEESNETGIVVVAKDSHGHGYTLGDFSGRYKPKEWAMKIVSLFEEYSANVVVAEVNAGGEMVEHTIHSVRKSIPVVQVNASRGKQTRAEPISLFYEQGKVHHVGVWPALEDQMCNWVPGEKSPDRMDALVWGFTHLMVSKGPVGTGFAVSGRRGASQYDGDDEDDD